MEHRTSAELKGVADVIHPQKLSKKERLERWALALEKRRGVRLRTLRETEYRPAKEQSALRQENFPLTVAFEDPVTAVGWSHERYIRRSCTLFWTVALAASRGGL